MKSYEEWLVDNEHKVDTYLENNRSMFDFEQAAQALYQLAKRKHLHNGEYNGYQSPSISSSR